MVRHKKSIAGLVGLAALILLTGALLAWLPGVERSPEVLVTREDLEQREVDVARIFHDDPHLNKGKTLEQIKESVEFVTGNVLFALEHETAHALISIFKIPVIGREEDAADAFATLVALRRRDSLADSVVTSTARALFLYGQRDKKQGTPNAFYSNHGLDVQRAYHIVCLLVGGAPEKFKAFADEVNLPKGRQETCKFDYSNAEWSWSEVLKPHKRKAGAARTKIEVSYAPTVEYTKLAELGRTLKILERVAEWLSRDFAWTKPISLEMKECGTVDARWIPSAQKIIVCYEIVNEFFQLHRQAVGAKKDANVDE